MECQFCGNTCQKSGFQVKTKAQKYLCTACGKYQQAKYIYKGCEEANKVQTIAMSNEGVGIRSTSRLLKISPTSVIKFIRAAAQKVKKPEYEESKTYEVDEMWTFIKTRDSPIWITYILERESSKVMDLVVGRKNKETLKPLIDRALDSNPKKICTDGLNTYPCLIPKPIHVVSKTETWRIERNNLTLRTHQARLTRKTIRYSKSETMLESSLLCYFFSG